MRKIPFADGYYLMAESRGAPMHVAAMGLFTLPKGVDSVRYLKNLREKLTDDVELRRPFADKVRMGPLGVAGNMYWETDSSLDLDYHVRHSALPGPGSYRELFRLVSRLHGTLLDRSRPLWELHLIEGLQNRQFATYMKVHHSAVDGVSAIRIMESMYAKSARKKLQHSPLSQAAYEEYLANSSTAKKPTAEASDQDVKNALAVLQGQVGSAVNVVSAFGDLANVWLRRNRELSVPFHRVPRTPFTSELTGARRVVAQSWPLERLRAVGKAMGGTINDAVLAMVAGALRAYLLNRRDLPRESLKGMTPVSISSENKSGASNAVGMVVVDLCTDEEDVARRIQGVKNSMDASKAQLRKMSKSEIEVYSILSHMPHLITQLLGLASRFPAYNTIISNVPGPRERRYWDGARVDGVYPLGIAVDGCALNFTLISNHQNLDFGIVACRKSLPDAQRLIEHLDESLKEIEEAVGR